MIKELWKLGHPMETPLVPNKYCILACKYSNYRVLYLSDLVKNKSISVPSYVTAFVAKEGAVIMIANIVKSVCVSILFRSLTKKLFIDYGYSKGLFYGIGSLSSDFKYGDPIVIVEGVADRDSLLDIYPNILSAKSSSLSLLQVSLLCTLTNNVILAFDNDSAGRNGNNMSKKRLEEKGVHCFILNHPFVKDSGTLYDYLSTGNTSAYSSLHTDYELLLKGAVLCLRK